MKNELTRKYGLITAICMVVGTVIGSGIFFRNEAIIGYSGGRIWIGIAAWLVGGFISLSSAYVFSVLAARYEYVGGLVDYSEALVSKGYGYIFGWFMATMFYPSLVGILAWVSARFTVELFGWETNQFFSGQTYVLALFYLMTIYVINALSQKLASKFQVSTTFIKIVPLVFMGLVGTIAGLANGTTVSNFRSDYVRTVVDYPFLSALLATIFAYLGWDSVLTINSEIKNSKRNLPIALVAGMLIIMTIYALYFVGIFSAAPVQELAPPPIGEGVRGAFVNVFNDIGGTALFVFIVISCLGTLNGLIVGGQRAFYALAVRGQGVKPELFSQVDKTTNVPHNSAAIFVFMASFWMLVFAGNFAGWYGDFNLELPGLLPIFFLLLLIPIYIMIMVKEKSLGIFNRFFAPVIASLGCLFLLRAAIMTQGWMRVLVFGAIFVGFMLAGIFFHRRVK